MPGPLLAVRRPGGKLGSLYCFAVVQARAQVDRPVAVVDAVNTVSPTLWYVHVDHLNRPIRMTDGTNASVWNAVWMVWGAPHAITGTAALNARFPGQWFQVESGLHYNWHRHYDPSLGRYTQPDPSASSMGRACLRMQRAARKWR